MYTPRIVYGRVLGAQQQIWGPGDPGTPLISTAEEALTETSSLTSAYILHLRNPFFHQFYFPSKGRKEVWNRVKFSSNTR